MTQHTYAGLTLDEIKAAAEAATPGPWYSVRNPYFHDICMENREYGKSFASVHANKYAGMTRDEEKCNSDFIAAANPAAVLAMVARIEELDHIELIASCGSVQNWLSLPDEDKARWFAISIKSDRERCQRINELESQVAGLGRAIADEATARTAAARFHCVDGWMTARNAAAQIAFEACLELPDGGSPTQMEAALCDKAAAAIRAMQPPAEWSELSGNSGRLPASTNADWPHPDGFAGGLTEPAQ